MNLTTLLKIATSAFSHSMHFVLFAALLLSAWAAPARLGHDCKQNMGRPCSGEEARRVLLDVPPGAAAIHLNQTLLAIRWLAVDTTTRLVINPALVVHNGTLHAFARLFLSNHTEPMTVCPNNTLYRAMACPNNMTYGLSAIVSFDLSPQLRPATVVSMLPHPHTFNFTRSVMLKEIYLGAEDPRTMTWGTDAYIVFTASPIADKWVTRAQRRMFAQMVLPVVGGIVMLDIGSSELKEKNWAPIGNISANEYLYSRFVDPHELVACNRAGRCRTAATTNRTEFFARFKSTHMVDEIHLGTNAVRVSDQYYGAILHAVQKETKHLRRYLNIPYLFDAVHPWSIRRVAPHPLNLPTAPYRSRFAFSTGLAYVDGRLVVSYNIDDKTSSFFVTTADEVFANTVAVVQ